MLQVNMSDVVKVLQSCVPYFVFLGIVAALAVAAIVVSFKLKQVSQKKLVRAEAGIAVLLALVIAVNLICLNPMYTLITLTTGSGTISEQSASHALELCNDIADEGIVLLKNEDNCLPLSNVTNLNVFGWASTNPIYGGTGSGSLNAEAEKVTLLQGLENAGFALNSELSDFYTAYRADRPEMGMFEQDFTLPEPPADSYSQELISNAANFSDTAVVVIARSGGENFDLPDRMEGKNYTNNSTQYNDFDADSHYLELSRTEKDMLELVCQNFDRVVVIINAANAMELGFLDEYQQIQGAVLCPGVGQCGFNSLGEILKGSVNPSGKTVDTYVTDLTATPNFNNFGSVLYENMTDCLYFDPMDGNITPHYVTYVEGIYVGYKFYETAYVEAQAGNMAFDYEAMVQYPFGYGLSYTTFSQSMGDITVQNGEISFDVTITNTGSSNGKDVVEVYYTPPYTNGGIEKAAVNLIEFAKTKELAPGESQIISISFPVDEMASFDYLDQRAYVLEKGDYTISVNTDAHTELDSKIYTQSETVVYDEDNARSSDLVTAVNRFDDAASDVVYLSRADGFSNYAQATTAHTDPILASEYAENFVWLDNYDPADYNDGNDAMPTQGAKNGLNLVDLRGADYDDARWETLLDEMTVDEMASLVALGGYQTAAVESINKVQTNDCDGPASINNNFTQVSSIGFPCGVVIAATWNKDIALAFGESIGAMADEMNVSGWYAPAMNLHRSAFAGRNFEYYSEDGILSGKIAAQAVIGAKEYGVYAYVKHFALNEQELDRNHMLFTWANEQSIRETYLKAFEIAIKDGGAQAVMSSYNFIGAIPTAASSALLQGVLRDEWGFRGMVLTDAYCVAGYQDADRYIRNGNDIMLCTFDSGTNHVDDKTSATGILALRQASKNILYTTVNSRAYASENLNVGMPGWVTAMIVADIAIIAGLIALEVLALKKYLERKKKAV